MAPEVFLCRSLASILSAAGLCTWREDGTAYAPSEHGLFIDQQLPTKLDNCTLLIPSTPTADGRAGMDFRVQITTRVKGSRIAMRDRAAAIQDLFDQREYTPAVLGISWAREYSRTYFDPDTQGRVMVAQNFEFRGRRPPRPLAGSVPVYLPAAPVIDGGTP